MPEVVKPEANSLVFFDDASLNGSRPQILTRRILSRVGFSRLCAFFTSLNHFSTSSGSIANGDFLPKRGITLLFRIRL